MLVPTKRCEFKSKSEELDYENLILIGNQILSQHWFDPKSRVDIWFDYLECGFRFRFHLIVIKN